MVMRRVSIVAAVVPRIAGLGRSVQQLRIAFREFAVRDFAPPPRARTVYSTATSLVSTAGPQLAPWLRGLRTSVAS